MFGDQTHEGDADAGSVSLPVARSVALQGNVSTPAKTAAARAPALAQCGNGESPAFGSPCVRSPCFGSPARSGAFVSPQGKWPGGSDEDSTRFRSVAIRQRATIDGSDRQELRAALSRSPKEFSSPIPKFRTRSSPGAVPLKAVARAQGGSAALPVIHPHSPSRDRMDFLSRTLPAGSAEGLTVTDRFEDTPWSARLNSVASAQGWVSSSRTQASTSSVIVCRTPPRRNAALSPLPFTTPTSVRMQSASTPAPSGRARSVVRLFGKRWAKECQGLFRSVA